MNAINDLSLKKIQKAELYLLLEFDKVCREQGFTYFLDSGTALGAIRHGGFIPWDDDIDVGMPRKDYDRFMEIGQSYLPDNIFLQNRRTEKNYSRYAAKLRLKGTIFPETDSALYEHNGIFIDIFPFDNIAGNRFWARLAVKNVVEMLHVIRTYRGHDLGVSPSRVRRSISWIIKRMPEGLINSLEKICFRIALRNENKETSFMTCYFWRMSQTKQYLFERPKMLPVKDIYFEGHILKIMKNPDYYLTLMYGNFMQLPPEEKRFAHLKGDVDLGSFE
jgi:lipopolysaccharide cholinephosphotransferase